MTEASYTALERILNNTDRTTDKVEVYRSDLKNIMRELRSRRREQGILGYDDGRMLVNDIGMTPIIKDHFRRLFPEYHFDSITVTRNVMYLEWEVRGTCGEFTLTTSFRKEYLEEKYQIKYQLP